MEIVKWLFMIVGIIVLLFIAVKILLYSEEKNHATRKKWLEIDANMEKMHTQMEDTERMLEAQNSMLEKVSQFFVKVNARLFK